MRKTQVMKRRGEQEPALAQIAKPGKGPEEEGHGRLWPNRLWPNRLWPN